MINLTLNNGVVMPQMGFGVYQIPEDQTAQAVVDAIASGYRKIDTAQSYFNEAQVGEGLRRAEKELGVKREDIFITTKIWLSNESADCGAGQYGKMARPAGSLGALWRRQKRDVPERHLDRNWEEIRQISGTGHLEMADPARDFNQCQIHTQGKNAAEYRYF